MDSEAAGERGPRGPSQEAPKDVSRLLLADALKLLRESEPRKKFAGMQPQVSDVLEPLQLSPEEQELRRDLKAPQTSASAAASPGALAGSAAAAAAAASEAEGDPVGYDLTLQDAATIAGVLRQFVYFCGYRTVAAAAASALAAETAADGSLLLPDIAAAHQRRQFEAALTEAERHMQEWADAAAEEAGSAAADSAAPKRSPAEVFDEEEEAEELDIEGYDLHRQWLQCLGAAERGRGSRNAADDEAEGRSSTHTDSEGEISDGSSDSSQEDCTGVLWLEGRAVGGVDCLAVACSALLQQHDTGPLLLLSLLLQHVHPVTLSFVRSSLTERLCGGKGQTCDLMAVELLSLWLAALADAADAQQQGQPLQGRQMGRVDRLRERAVLAAACLERFKESDLKVVCVALKTALSSKLPLQQRGDHAEALENGPISAKTLHDLFQSFQEAALAALDFAEESLDKATNWRPAEVLEGLTAAARLLGAWISLEPSEHGTRVSFFLSVLSRSLACMPRASVSDLGCLCSSLIAAAFLSPLVENPSKYILQVEKHRRQQQLLEQQLDAAEGPPARSALQPTSPAAESSRTLQAAQLLPPCPFPLPADASPLRGNASAELCVKTGVTVHRALLMLMKSGSSSNVKATARAVTAVAGAAAFSAQTFAQAAALQEQLLLHPKPFRSVGVGVGSLAEVKKCLLWISDVTSCCAALVGLRCSAAELQELVSPHQQELLWHSLASQLILLRPDSPTDFLGHLDESTTLWLRASRITLFLSQKHPGVCGALAIAINQWKPRATGALVLQRSKCKAFLCGSPGASQDGVWEEEDDLLLRAFGGFPSGFLPLAAPTSRTGEAPPRGGSL
ncbi:uncharacterized protein LOC34624577 [Cyclospora cayetanensis]|uniref:Uncharacterized protein LOC34624577 n=1 Tax=Cyclospora cayetanensis TaxID=88456 RepID=A0A6P6S130_9EIME|nr:uncharacterized protein LOC34624577 [Cyclospora cayetanensis]